MPLTGRRTTLSSDVLLNPGVVYVGTTPMGVTRGATNFDPGNEYENLTFDGKQSPIMLLDRKFHGTPRVTFTMLEFGDAATGAQIPQLEPGSVNASAGNPNITTITPPDGGGFVASASYLTDFRIIWDRGVGTGTERYACLHFFDALCTAYTVSSNGTRGEAEISVTIEARKDMAAGDVADAAYEWELREALPS